MAAAGRAGVGDKILVENAGVDRSVLGNGTSLVLGVDCGVEEGESHLYLAPGADAGAGAGAGAGAVAVAGYKGPG